MEKFIKKKIEELELLLKDSIRIKDISCIELFGMNHIVIKTECITETALSKLFSYCKKNHYYIMIDADMNGNVKFNIHNIN